MNWRKKKRIMRLLRRGGIDGCFSNYMCSLGAWEVILSHGLGTIIKTTFVVQLDYYWVANGWNARRIADALRERYMRQVQEANSRVDAACLHYLLDAGGDTP